MIKLILGMNKEAGSRGSFGVAFGAVGPSSEFEE